jgi:hypothetical protein
MKRNQKLLLAFALLFPFQIWAQFSDNFSDGNFTANPQWTGIADNFVVTNGELQLNDADFSHTVSYLSSPVALKDTATWEFLVRLNFSPSTSNYVRIYLASSNADLTGSLSGFFIQIGASGSTDALELRKQSGTSTSLFLSGTAGAVSVNPNVRVRITRSAAGEWRLFADYAGGTNFVAEGSATDATPLDGSFLGVRCNYTTTNKANFFFDDFKAGPIFVDGTPPNLLTAAYEDATHIVLTFDEPMSAASAQILSNYALSNGLSVTAVEVSDNVVTLTVSPAMTSGQSYTLNVSGVKDLAGNAMVAGSKSFTYYNIQIAEAGDILINEIMADPDPVVGLPNAEFVELYNRSNKAIDLGGMGIASGGTPQVLPSFILVPGAFVIVCDDGKAAEFTSFGDVVAVGSFPALSNTGDVVTLTDAAGAIINEVNYTDDWYQSSSKDEGGWSLELINPNLYCHGATNWIASNDAKGGTPGQQNSVYNDTPDTTAPSLVSALAVANNQLLLTFDEIMGASAEVASNYTIASGVGSVTSAVLQEDKISVLLTIASPYFVDRSQYTITANSVTDCVGNAIGTAKSATFTYYETQAAEPFDILINEMFIDNSPALGLPSAEFVELYNRTDKAFNLFGFTFTVGTNSKTLPFYILEPNAYVIMCDINDAAVYQDYGNTIGIASFPSLPNTEGRMVLSSAGITIDAVDYTDDWYADDSKDAGGWSLERINPNAPCEGASNWHASLNLNGGTPGDQNSVFDDNASRTVARARRIFPLSSIQLEVNFDQALDAASATSISNYSIDNGIGIASVSFAPNSNSTLWVNLSTPLSEGVVYTLTVNETVHNCIDEAVEASSLEFGLFEDPEAGDLLISEVLFNPFTGGVDFVEFYNTSDKIINLYDILIGNITDTDTTVYRMGVDFLVLPQTYVAVTEDTKKITAFYHVENPQWLVQIANLPNLENDKGNVTIYIGEITDPLIVDAFDYSEDYHNDLLDAKDGVSLERIDLGAPAQSASNWTSAAEAVGYATPTYKNSQFFANARGDSKVSLPKKTFSPDGDGYDDVLTINYKLGQAGYLGSVTIYDARGRLVKRLYRSEILGQEGSFLWDGATYNNEKARVGIYVVFVEMFDSSGKVERFKETCVLAGKVN